MIARLTGALVEVDGARGVVDVGGVGYEIFAPTVALHEWTGEDSVVVHVHTVVREDAIALYGFKDGADRAAFRVLIGVSGVGPKLALAALDTLGADGLADAISRDDVGALNKIPGVGKKTAQRLALELKGKLAVRFEPLTAARTKKATSADPLALALARLEYGKSEIDRALQGLRKEGIADDAPLGERLRRSLRLLSGTQ